MAVASVVRWAGIFCRIDKGLMTMPLKVSEVKRGYGDFSWERIPGSRWVRIDAEWVHGNIVRVFVPQLAGVDTYGGKFSGQVRCHKKIASALVGAFEKVADEGLGDRLQFYGGAYAPRLMSGRTDRLSRHAWGIAIDLNCNGHNRYGEEPDAPGSTYSMHEVAVVFEKFGFEWGGKWKRPDGMHLEYVGGEEVNEAKTRRGPFISLNGERLGVDVQIRDGIAYANLVELATALAGAENENVEVASFARSHGYDVVWVAETKEIRLRKR